MDDLIQTGDSLPAEQPARIAAISDTLVESPRGNSPATLSQSERLHARSSGACCNDEIQPCLSVVMPVYNESATVAEMIKKVLSQRPVQQLVIVDDASTDGTREELGRIASDNSRVKVLSHSRNLGKGAALRSGFAHVTSPVVIVQDADTEYDPTEYYLVLNPILNGKADVVYGSRFLGAGSRRVLYYWHAVGNTILTTLSNMATNLNLSDMETCYKVFRREVVQQIHIQENRFGFEPEITAKISKLGVRIFEVAISYNGRTYAEGKKVGWQDGVHALWCIFKYNFLA